MKYLFAIILFLFVSPAFAHYDEPSPQPSPAPANSSPSNDSVKYIAIGALAVLAIEGVYCIASKYWGDDRCGWREKPAADDHPLDVAPKSDQTKVRLYQ